MPYSCSYHPDTAAVALFTNLQDGDTVNVCGECVHPFAANLAAMTAPAEPEQPADDPAPAEGQPAPQVDPNPSLDPHTAPGERPEYPQPDPDHVPDPQHLDPDYPAPRDPRETTPGTAPGPDDPDDDDEARGFSASTIAHALWP